MTPALVDRFRRLPPARRDAFLAHVGTTPGKLSDLRHAWESFWARPDQIVTFEELLDNPIVLFTGERGAGKTRAAIQLWLREIFAGRSQRPRIFAATESDVAKVVVGAKKTGEPDDGIMACLPREDRPVWIADEGPAGVLRFKNGVEAICFSANVSEGAVSYQGDLDLLDDIAKWGPYAEKTWTHQQISCRKGNGVTIVATTRRGTDLLRRLLGTGTDGPIPGVLIRRPPMVDANRSNLTSSLRRRTKLVIGGDLARQEMDDEDVGASKPFGGLPWPKIHVPVVHRAELEEQVVAVDPADGKGGDHDEWGIGAAARRTDRHVVALEDVSGSYDDAEAGEAILALCERRGINKIVVEVNRGPRVLGAIRAAYYARELRRLTEDPKAARRAMPEILPIVAQEGKRLRAGPVRTLYLDGLLHHAPGLGELDMRGVEPRSLEKQMREWDPLDPKRPRQDDRVDWLVHAVTYLADLAGRPGHLSEAQEQDIAIEQCKAAAEMNAALIARARGKQPDPGLMKVASAAPGDTRHAGTPRTAGRTGNWRSRSVF